MNNPRQFEQTPSGCAACEAMLPDAVDGALSAAEQAAFDRHLAVCPDCMTAFADARRGAAWLSLLKQHAPVPPADLFAKILTSTSAAMPSIAANPAALSAFAPEPVSKIWTRPRAEVVPANRGLFARLVKGVSDLVRIENEHAGFQPRVAMTASMAFFSIALSLNLMGVRLSDVSHLSLRPSTISRSVADTRASLTRSIQNNRVVYQFESRVVDMRHDELPGERYDPTPSASPAPDSTGGSTAPERQKEQPQPGKPHGSSDLVLPVAPTPRSISRKDA